MGQDAGATNTTGSSNTFTGDDTGYNNTVGTYDTFSGTSAGASNTRGNENSFFGYYSGYNNTTGSDNAFFGVRAGVANVTGSNNIEIGNEGSSADNRTIRIGTQGTQTSAYMAGIFGNKNSNLSPVLIDSNGRLWQGVTQPGVVTSFNGRTGAVVSQTGDYSFSLLSGTLLDGQGPATYNSQITLANPLNVYYGDGSHLTGIQHQPVIKGQQQQIDSQQKQIEQMQQRLAQLEAVVAQLTQAAAKK